MAGAPEAAAKALVLAICRRILPQRRAVHLLLFGGPGEWTELRLARGSGGLEALLGFLALAFQAGTDLDGPLVRALDLLEDRELRKADILLVTDGLVEVRPDVLERLARAREESGVRVFSVVLDTWRLQSMAAFSDEAWQLDPRALARAAGVFERVGPQR
jgi:uncharacterized protein with von Willebrand factor type A (vWA) domain